MNAADYRDITTRREEYASRLLVGTFPHLSMTVMSKTKYFDDVHVIEALCFHCGTAEPIDGRMSAELLA